jgi:pyroglutamyl-peptidase
MKKRILLTSFDICLKNQQSNSADDLLLEVTKLDLIPNDLSFLRQLPVDMQLTTTQIMEKSMQFDLIKLSVVDRLQSLHN